MATLIATEYFHRLVAEGSTSDARAMEGHTGLTHRDLGQIKPSYKTLAVFIRKKVVTFLAMERCNKQPMRCPSPSSALAYTIGSMYPDSPISGFPLGLFNDCFSKLF